MDNGFGSKFRRIWDIIFNKEPPVNYDYSLNFNSRRPDRHPFSTGTIRSIAMPVYNRIAIDVSAISIVHAKMDENGRYKETVNSGLNRCLTVESNPDQIASAFIQDIVLSMFDEGVVAVVPIDYEVNSQNEITDVLSMRTGKIVSWNPNSVQVSLYNDDTGNHDTVWVEKKHAAIIENPFYAVMNEPNSVAKRLMRKLNLLDAIDEQSGSGKLDMIIQLPYSTRSISKKKYAEERKATIENQLRDSPFGIAYIDAAEKIIQLNRPVTNNLMDQVQYLTDDFYSQIGISKEILNGTADEKTMTNYQNGTISTIVSTIVGELTRKFIPKQAFTENREQVFYFIDPFKYATLSNIVKISDTLRRNEIVTSNEIRQVIGLKPSEDSSSDELRNPNISSPGSTEEVSNKDENANEEEEEPKDV